MKRLEEQVTCEDDAGQRYLVEVYRNLEREDHELGGISLIRRWY